MRLNKLAKRIFAVGMAVSLMMANAGMSFADNKEAFKYEPVKGTETQFTKYLALEDGVTVPNVNFSFKIEAGDPVEKDNILAGIGSPTVEEAKFNSSMQTKDVAADGKIDGIAVTGKKYAETLTKIDFSKVEFSAPGIYRYKLSEEKPTAPGVSAKTTSPLYLDVFVTSGDTKDSLKVESYVLHRTTDKPVATSEQDKKAADKVEGFVNEYKTQGFSFAKKVTGNQGDRTKYFTFTLKLKNENMKGSTIAVDVSGASSSDNTTKEIKLDDATGESQVVTYKLQNGDKIEIKGLPDGTQYTVVDSYEDYEASLNVEGMQKDTDKKEASITGTVNGAKVELEFTNKKDGTIPTGVILDSAPFILVIALAAAALVITAARKRAR